MTATATAKPLTARQTQVYKAILQHYAVHGTAPSMRDIMAAMGYASTNAVTSVLRVLAKKGYVTVAGKLARGVTAPVLADAVKAAAVAELESLLGAG